MLCNPCQNLDLDTLRQPAGQEHHESFSDLLNCAVNTSCELCCAVVDNLKDQRNLDHLGVPVFCRLHLSPETLEWRQEHVLPGSGYERLGTNYMTLINEESEGWY
jgi:hypothetical protein